jgi:hypothetical protein
MQVQCRSVVHYNGLSSVQSDHLVQCADRLWLGVAALIWPRFRDASATTRILICGATSPVHPLDAAPRTWRPGRALHYDHAAHGCTQFRAFEGPVQVAGAAVIRLHDRFYAPRQWEDPSLKLRCGGCEARIAMRGRA